MPAYGTNLPYALALSIGFAAALNLGQPRDETIADLLWTGGILALAFAVGLTTRKIRAREAALEARAAALDREREQRAAAAAAEEHRRIARELHDIISHSLGVVILQAGAAEQMLDRNPARARDALALIRDPCQEAIDEMGTLVGLMRTGTEAPREPQPSLADLDRLVARTSEAGMRVQISIEGSSRPLAAALQLSAYRIVQEGLTKRA